MPGIINAYRKSASQSIANSVVLVSIGLDVAIAANQTRVLKYWVPFSCGATGGFRAQVVGPAGLNYIVASYKVVENTSGIALAILDISNSPVADALSAADFWLEVEATVTAGATAGTLGLQMAQDTSDALPLDVFEGATLLSVTL